MNRAAWVDTPGKWYYVLGKVPGTDEYLGDDAGDQRTPGDVVLNDDPAAILCYEAAADITNEQLDALANAPQVAAELRDAAFMRTRHLSNDGLRRFARLTSIRRLTLGSCPRIGLCALHEFLTLIHLDLVGSRLGGGTMRDLCALTQLEVLNAWSFEPSGSLQELECLSNLRAANFRKWDCVTDADVTHLLSRWNQIRVLVLTECPGITSGFLRTLAGHPSLEEVAFTIARPSIPMTSKRRLPVYRTSTFCCTIARAPSTGGPGVDSKRYGTDEWEEDHSAS